MDAVTGASSYTGRYITRELLHRGRSVLSLARSHDARVFPKTVGWRQLDFHHPSRLVESLREVDTLYNTYWIRFPRETTTFEKAVENTRVLVDAAGTAGIRRLVHLSVSNVQVLPELPYFCGKAATEKIVQESGISHAIIRPTVVFGVEDILINNIAWLLRHFPVYLIPGAGMYRIRPIYAGDVAEISADAGARTDNLVTDAAGPDVLAYIDLVEAIRSAVGSRSRVVHVTPRVALFAAWVVGRLAQDVIVTPEELEGLMREAVMSAEAPRGTTRFADWLDHNAHMLGHTFVSERKRHWSPSVA